MITPTTLKLTSPRAALVAHHDPLARRTLWLECMIEDGRGRPLAVPEPIDVTGFTLFNDEGQRECTLSFSAGTLCGAVADALLREFEGRLRADPGLRDWLTEACRAFTGPEKPLVAIDRIDPTFNPGERHS